MAIPKPFPLYPTYAELKDMDLQNYPHLMAFFSAGLDGQQTADNLDVGQVNLNQANNKELKLSQVKTIELNKAQWTWGRNYLLQIGRNKSEHTYTRFRSEVERFLLWAMIIKEKPLDELRKTDILDYADFCWKPPVTWISLVSRDRFEYRNGFYQCNPQWRPFKFSQPKHAKTDSPDLKTYKPSQQTLTSTFVAITTFYKYLMQEEVCYGNPAQIAKNDCRYFIADAQVKDVRRLSEDQWDYVLETAQFIADQDENHERSLFIIATMKTLFLRVSELSERKDWSPVMGHFWEDDAGNWWLKIYGKGRKLRDITVPDAYLRYLKRYRAYRGLSQLPYSGDNTSLVEKIRGSGGMTSRHITRIVQHVFDLAYERMHKEMGENAARKLKEASTHWLRHTGASMEIERGRPLKDVSEDLGHASMATTDTVYVQTENKKRAESGKSRTVGKRK